MKYPYDNRAISFINRTFNAVRGETTVGNTEDVTSASYYATPGVSQLVALLWIEADRNADYSDEFDEASGEFPLIDAAFKRSMSWPQDMSDDLKRAEETMHVAFSMAEAFCSRIWLASCVTNALLSLEADLGIIWSSLERTNAVMSEFDHDKQLTKDRIHHIFATDPYWSSILHKDLTSRG